MGTTSTAQPPTAVKEPERLGPRIGGVAVKAEKAGNYWVGVRPWKRDDPESRPPPMHFFNIGPVTFPTWSTPWEGKGEDGNGVRGRYPGAIVRLTESQVGRLVTELKRTAVRWRERKGQHAHGYLVRAETQAEVEDAAKRWKLTDAQVAAAVARIESFRDGDEPVAMFIYCVPTDLPEGSTARPGSIPASVWDTGIPSPN